MLLSSFWVMFSIVAGRGVVILAGMLIASNLGAAAFAAFAFIHVTSTSLSNIATLGMQNTLPRYFARLDIDRTDNTFSQIFIAYIYAVGGLALAVIGIAFTPLQAIAIPEPGTKHVLALLLFAVGFNNLCIGASNGLERFRGVSMATVAQAIALLISAAIAIAYREVAIALWGYIFSSLLSTTLLLPGIVGALRGQIRSVGIKIDRANAVEVIGFCGPLFISTMLFNSGMWICGRALLGEGKGTSEFAEFAFGMHWFGLASLAPAVIGRVVLPRITKLGHLGRKSENSQVILQGVLLSLCTTVVALIGAWLFSGLIVSFYGRELYEAKLVLILFVFVAVIASPIDIISSGLMSINRQKLMTVVMFFWWLSLMAMLLLIGVEAAESVVTMIAISYSIALVLFVFIGRKEGLFSKTEKAESNAG